MQKINKITVTLRFSQYFYFLFVGVLNIDHWLNYYLGNNKKLVIDAVCKIYTAINRDILSELQISIAFLLVEKKTLIF